jgi:hypothetical protein
MASSEGGGGIPILGAIFNSIVGGLDSAVQIAFNYVGSWLNNLLHNLVGLFKSVGAFLSTIAHALRHIWENYIKAAIKWLADHVQKLRAWLKRTIGPLITRLQKIKKWYDTHILPQQLKMLKMIQAARRVLGILRLFHVKWAAKLDNSLADLQNRIEESINIVRGTLNQIINTLAIAFDPTMLITGNVLGASLLANLGAVKRIFGFGDGRLLSASEAATIQHDSTRYFTSNVTSNVGTRNATGPTAEDQANRKAARAALASATGAPLRF